MSLAVAIQMDPVEPFDINGDSSFVLGVEAQERGYALWHYLPNALSLRDGKVTARAQRLELRRERLGPLLQLLHLLRHVAVAVAVHRPGLTAWVRFARGSRYG